MNDFEIMAAKAALKAMLRSDYFSICAVDKVLKISGCIPNGKDYAALSALHCIHWRDMEPALREMVVLKVAQMFENPGLDVGVIDNAFSRHKLLLSTDR